MEKKQKSKTAVRGSKDRYDVQQRDIQGSQESQGSTGNQGGQRQDIHSSDSVLDIMAATIQSLCRKLNLPDEETARYVEKVKERDMGYLWENMEPMDIQAERQNTKEAREKLKQAEMELENSKDVISKQENLIQEKQSIIEEKDARIVELERELSRYKKQ